MPAADDRTKTRRSALKALKKIVENEQEPVADRIRAADLILKATAPTNRSPFYGQMRQQGQGAIQ